MQCDTNKQEAERDKHHERGNVPEPVPEVRQCKCQQKRENKNCAVREVGHETLDAPEIERGKDISDEKQVQRAKQRSHNGSATAGEAGAAENERGHRDKCVSRALRRVA